MKYICLIYSDETTNAVPGTPEFEKVIGDYMAFGEEIGKAGVAVAGEPLQPVATATTVSIRNGKTHVTDGPFAETKEQLGGFYILDCKDLDEAIEYAVKIPTATHGCIEVRPIMEIPGMED